MKTKIEKLAQIESDNLDLHQGPSELRLENYSTKSVDESKASVYFTPNEGHMSPQPLQTSPIHINYMHDHYPGAASVLSPNSSETTPKLWKSVVVTRTPKKHVHHHNHHPHHRYSYTPKFNGSFLDEEDEENFIIPDQLFRSDTYDLSCDCFDTIAAGPIKMENGISLEPSTSRGRQSASTRSSLKSLPSTSGYSASRLRNRPKDSRSSFEKENLLSPENHWAPQVYEFNNRDSHESDIRGVLKRKRKSKLSDTFYSMEDVPATFDSDEAPQSSTKSSSGSPTGSIEKAIAPPLEKKNSHVSIDEKSGKILSFTSSNSSNDCPDNKDSEMKPNINEFLQDDKPLNDNKFILLQQSNSLPEIAVICGRRSAKNCNDINLSTLKSSTPSSTATISSSSNNNSLISSSNSPHISNNNTSNGKNVILAVNESQEAADFSKLNQIGRNADKVGSSLRSSNSSLGFADRETSTINKKNIVLNIDPLQSISNSSLIDGVELELHDVSTSSV